MAVQTAKNPSCESLSQAKLNPERIATVAGSVWVHDGGATMVRPDRERRGEHSWNAVIF
jgi:hypothetical protein